MSVTVDHSEADQVLRDAIMAVVLREWMPHSEFSGDIAKIVLGEHKTYRYILINGLLAKATNETCNPLVLQAGSTLSGAFDARSLCHKVVVPLEKELLGGRLGASNEPFLNKPARFPELSSSNAVRKGMDTELLATLISIFRKLNSSLTAVEALKDSLYFVMQRESRNLSDLLPDVSTSKSEALLVPFAKYFVTESHGGETSAIVAGTCFSLLGKILGSDFDVRTHKVNQAGSSSNEVSDIDVYEEGCLIYSAEVKDKIFSAADVEHAIRKVAEADHFALIFLKGPRAHLVDTTEDHLIELWAAKGVALYFIGVVDYLASILTISIADVISVDDFIRFLSLHAESAIISDSTFSHLKESIDRLYG